MHTIHFNTSNRFRSPIAALTLCRQNIENNWLKQKNIKLLNAAGICVQNMYQGQLKLET